MSFQVPTEWQYDSPEALIVGNGPYARALAYVLGSVCLSMETLKAGMEAFDVDGYLLVLKNLKRVFIVVSTSLPPSDAIRCHRMAWTWVAKLSPLGDQHDLVFVFVLPPDGAAGYEGDLALGLGIQDIDPKTVGIAFWRSSGSLYELLDVLEQVQPMDLPPLRARQKADVRHLALEHLRKAVQSGDPVAIRRFAQDVLTVFSGHEYHLDLFCNSPSHQNGNLFRNWLHAVVTEPVTPEQWDAAHRKSIGDWLTHDYQGHK